MFGISYKLKLLEPVLANHLAGDSNTARSFKFVPGAVMRGAVIKAYQESNSHNLDASDEKTRRLFFDGKTRFLHAYPFVQRYNRALPVPLSWYKRKDDEPTKEAPVTVYDFSRAFDESGEQAVGRDKFCVVPDYAYELDASYRLNVHTQRDAELGRSAEDRGAIYRYEALPKDTALMGVVLTESEEDAKEIRALMNGLTVYLGKARTAGYGRVQVENVELLVESWRELERKEQLATSADEFYFEGLDEDSDNYESPTLDSHEESEAKKESSSESPALTTSEFTITFLSEAIVRDENGQHTIDPLPALRKRLGLDQDAKLSTQKGERNLVFRQPKTIGGFNRKWNLPLPQVPAIDAGSVFVIQSATPIELSALRRLEETGIGGRRAEGYGRLTVDWIVETTLNYAKLPDELASSEDHEQLEGRILSDDEKAFATQFLLRLLRHDLDDNLIEAVNQTNVSGKIPNSQLSRWRTIIRSTFAQRDIARLNNFLGNEERKASAAWEKMRRARVNGIRLTDWMKELLTAENKFDALTKGLRAQDLPERSLTASLRVAVTDELADEYRLRLLDAVLKRHAKKQAGQGKNQGGSHAGT